jgi:L-alanine-DL-glutamate epimerase-like enolase superfamily enzyme
MTLKAQLEPWRYKVPFVIARGRFEVQHMLVCTYEGEGITAQAEAEADEGNMAGALLRTAEAAAILSQGLPPPAQVAMLAPGPVRNAIDCLLWDIEAKRQGARAWTLADLPITDDSRVETVMTVTIDTPDAMARASERLRGTVMLKVKLGAGGIEMDIERTFAVASAAPGSVLLIDPNEGWSMADLLRFIDAARGLDIALLEQPLPAHADDALVGFRSPIPICADEACTTTASLPRLVGRYDSINIKLDKTGGLTEALALKTQARRLGFGIMTGCNGGTSLAIAPAFLLAAGSDVVDLDGPLYLTADRPSPIRFDGQTLSPPDRALWG